MIASQKKKVSVIVPVYNVEKYIDKCLDSLVKQTLKDIEIIVVNDGSCDNSQEIIDRYAEKYPEKIIAYQKKNGGLGDARNYGINRATGEYIGFVDSDDWVDEKMFQAMYDMAVNENMDVVICDFVEINDGWATGHIARGYRGEAKIGQIDDFMFMLNSLTPATACNKIYRRELFYITRFPTQWYEDIATTPILLSYSNKVGYLPIGFYYYRQVESSITKREQDRRNLDVIQSWERCLQEVNKKWLEPMEAAIYESIGIFLSFKPQFAEDYLQYARNNKERFLQNAVIKQRIKSGENKNLFKMQLIPRKIHYFWFGGGEKSELIQRCIESWKKYAPDFEIIEWNESNCDIHVNRYVEEAYAAKKWAFVTDYFRMEKIAEYGGLYFDTDMELMRNPSCLLLSPAFFAFETKDAVNACAFGAVAHHPIVSKCRKSYMKASFRNNDGTFNTSYTIVRRITEQLDKYGLVLNGKEQTLSDGTKIYPPNKLTLDMFDGEIIAQHHYDCSWWNVKVGVLSYKNTVLRDYFSTTTTTAVQNDNPDLIFQRDYYKSEFERLENSTCWKITAPLRAIADFIKRVLEINSK